MFRTIIGPRRAGACLGAIILLTNAPTVDGQQILWRSDYNAARKEAAEKNRPLVIDFYTDNCIWCQKLDAGPLRDATVAGILVDKFVALKVNADRTPGLMNVLQIQNFPTLVLAAPDGKILRTIEGFVEAPKLVDELNRAHAAVLTPDWMTRDFQEAAKAIAKSNYSGAVALLKTITHDGKDRPVQVKARQVLFDLEQQAAGRLARARQLHDQGRPREAADALTDLLRSYTGTQAAVEGGKFLNALAAKPELRDAQRGHRARELLAQARSDFRSQQYLECLERCETLTAAYADLPEAAEAGHLSAQVRDNPEALAKACDALNQRTAAMYLTLAECWLRKGQPGQAQLCLERVIETVPGSCDADTARTHLAQIQGRTPTYQAEYKKP